MTGLETWLNRATRGLSEASNATVRAEILDHYESAREALVFAGAAEEESHRLALAELGDARTAHCHYAKILLTAAEEGILRSAGAEARAICSRPWLQRVLFALPLIWFAAAAVCFAVGSLAMGWTLLSGAATAGLFLMAPFMPLYTPRRALVFRCVKWAVLVCTVVLGLKSTWMIIACLWPLVWIESTRVSIRRKMPVADWPKQLYL